MSNNMSEKLKYSPESPFLYTYTSNNVKYNFNDYNGETTDAKKYYSGLNDINNNYRYVLWSQSNTGQRYPILLSRDSLNYMSSQITKRLNGVHPDGKNIIVPDDTIKSVADSVFQNNSNSFDVLQEMIINYIVSQIKTEYETVEKK